MGINGSDARPELAVEELREVSVGGKVWVGDFGDVDAKYVAVEFESRGSEKDWERLGVEPAPCTGYGFEGEGREDLDLPRRREESLLVT